MTLEPEPRYAVNATLTDADLARCAQRVRRRAAESARQDRRHGRSQRQRPHPQHAVRHGTVRLSNADVYELPVMISLLKILSIRPPDQNAFSDATIDYRIEGEHIYFDRIDSTATPSVCAARARWTSSRRSG